MQGVGFRFWTQKNAEALDLKGFVKNLADGRVEAVFEGDDQDIQQMLAKAKKGPAAARVLDMDIEYTEFTGCFSLFEIQK